MTTTIPSAKTSCWTPSAKIARKPFINLRRKI
jgi:hypothetical protein